MAVLKMQFDDPAWPKTELCLRDPCAFMDHHLPYGAFRDPSIACRNVQCIPAMTHVHDRTEDWYFSGAQ